MAEEALKKIEEQLKCSICLDTYTDPKLLHCFHVYCRQCLVPLVDRNQQGKLGLACPICRQITPIPDRGVAGLQPAFHINHLLEIQDSVKKFDNPAAALEGAVGITTIATPSRDVEKHCFEHPAEEVKLYCETCGELVCYKCALIDGKHRSHDYKQLDQAFQEYKEGIISSLEPMEKQVVVMKEAIAELDTCRGVISDQQTVIKYKIFVTFKRFRKVLDVRETELIDELNKITEGRLKDLAAQKDQIEITLARLCSCLQYARESLKTSKKGDLLTMKRNTVHQVKELTTSFPPDTWVPNTSSGIVFSALTDLTAGCRNYGQLLATGSPDPSRCRVTGEGVETALVREKSTAVLHAFNFKGEPCDAKLLESELSSTISGTRASCNVERRGRSHYKISYQPTLLGKHWLHVKVEGQHIRGSPFYVTVTSPVDKLSTPILSIGWTSEPWGVAVTNKGEVVVTEWGGHCVSVFSPEGGKIRSFGSCGCGLGQFRNPTGVAVDGEGNILVVDKYNHRIQKFTTNGRFLADVGTKGSAALQFKYPTDVVCNDNNGKVYVTDRRNHRIQVLNSDLTFSSTFGACGSGDGQFNRPCGIACDSTVRVYVVDWENHRIQVFTAEGVFLRILGEYGHGIGKLFTPNCIAIDPSDMVYVSDRAGVKSHVSVFTSEGRFVTSFGSKLDWSVGLAVGASGVVYVCDHQNDCVQVYT